MSSIYREAGTTILDTGCYKHLASDAAQAKLLGNLRATNWEIWPSALNVFEILQHPTEHRRRQLLNTVRVLAEDRPLLAIPQELLKRVASAIARGEEEVTADATGWEWIYLEQDQLTEAHFAAAKRYLKSQEEQFTQLHDGARKVLQNFLKAHDMRSAWAKASEFLDCQWTTVVHLGTYIERAWDALGLPGKANIPAVLENETWRLYLEGYGVAAYERAISQQTPRRAQHTDLLQLVYLADRPRRMLVSADHSLLRAARSVLVGRYPRVRVVHISKLLE